MAVSYHLYLDESGRFQRRNEKCLIGGFLIPSEDGMGEKAASNLLEQIRNQALREGIVTEDELKNGESIHASKGRSSTGQTLSEQKSYYVFEHCSENPPTDRRWKIQGKVFGKLMDRLQGLSASVVIFDNARGVYEIDSNTTFLSMMALGLMELYTRLKKKHSGESLRLFVHMAERKDITRSDEPELEDISPTRNPNAGEKVLSLSQYANQLKSCAFLNGGFKLWEARDFRAMMDHLEILRDVRTGGQWRPNPLTVICDYICNGFYTRGHGDIDTVLRRISGEYVLDVFDRKELLNTDFSMDYMRENHRWDEGYVELFVREFPPAPTEEYFRALAQEAGLNRLEVVDSICSKLRFYVETRVNMEDMIRRIDRARSHCGRMEPEAGAFLDANLLLFLNALYTHLGKMKGIRQTRSDFLRCIPKVRDLTRRTSLLVLYANREIVSCMDRLDYSGGQAFFRMISRYFQGEEELISNLLLDFCEICKQDLEQDMDIRQVEYGRALGSYLQILTHWLRVEKDAGRRESLIGESRGIQAEASKHFLSWGDRKRAFQNLCDLHVSLGEEEEALWNLYCAIAPDNERGERPACAQMAGEIIAACGHWPDPENIQRLYLYLHYIQILRHAQIHGSPLQEDLLEALRDGRKLCGENLCRGDAEVYPFLSVQWHLCAALAWAGTLGGKEKEFCLETLSRTGESLLNDEPVFRPIGLAVLAEAIALIGKGCLADASLDKRISRWQTAYGKLKEQHPEALLFEQTPEAIRVWTWQDYLRFSESVAY